MVYSNRSIRKSSIRKWRTGRELSEDTKHAFSYVDEYLQIKSRYEIPFSSGIKPATKLILQYAVRAMGINDIFLGTHVDTNLHHPWEEARVLDKHRHTN